MDSVKIWYDGKIMPGANTDISTFEALKEAQIVLLLLSADFINSDFLYENILPTVLKMQRNGEARVIPIVVRDCDWKITPLGKLKSIPINGIPPDSKSVWETKDKAYLHIVQELNRAVYEEMEKKGIAATTDSIKPKSPYRQGRVLYLIPEKMELLKKHLCQIRIAPEEVEDALLKAGIKQPDLAVIEDIRIDSVMKAELMDDSGEDAFDIKLQSTLEQPIEDDAYTEWRYNVTPKKAGNGNTPPKVDKTMNMQAAVISTKWRGTGEIAVVNAMP